MTQTRGIIKLIPKKDAEPFLIKNWRPITLLNCDYKIGAKAIANRLKTFLPKLINSDQTGFLKGRFIGENIRLIDGIINFTAAKNIPGLLLFLDFEKAFDTVEWPFLQKTFQHFNFGPSIINWIKLCYSNIESCVLNNGWSTDFFKLERGVRQGCPLSTYLFILGVEILAEKIRTNKSVKGICIQENEIKLSQYADDTTLILDGSKESFTSALQDLDNFSAISGLRLNSKKTEALWIGTYINRGETLCPERDLKWVKNKVKALGVWLSTYPEETMELNYREKLTKVNNCLTSWEYRRLSFLGKITVLKSLIASKLVYILSPLPTNHRALEEINNLFFKFLWSGKGDKIKRTIMISDYLNGGLRMIDIKSFNMALKSAWVKKHLDPTNQGKWKLVFNSELQYFGGPAVFKGNLNKDDLSHISTSDLFTKEIMKIWSEISYEANIQSKDHYLSMSLWHNSLIRIDKKPVYYKQWCAKGIQTVAHLMKDSTAFLSFSEFKERFDIETNFLTFHGLISAIKSVKKITREQPVNNNAIFKPFLEKFLQAKKPNRQVYKKLIANKQTRPNRSQGKWVAECELDNHNNNNIDWQSVYQSPFRCTKNSKLITFQFKLLHRRLATNNYLKKISLKEDNICTFCKTEAESLIHLFWSCKITSCFWHSFNKWLPANQSFKSLSLTPDIILGLRPDIFENKQHYLFS